MSKHVGKMLESSINGARKVLYKYVKIENRLISFTLYKNPFKIEYPNVLLESLKLLHEGSKNFEILA